MANNKTSNTRRRALGRGLSNLIPTEPYETETSGSDKNSDKRDIQHVKRSEIRTNPFQPRTEFKQEEIENLAESIKNQGLLQPVVLRKKIDGFEIISGERRFRALGFLGESSVPAIVKEQVSDREMLEMALVENIQREDLNEMEKAHAYDKLLLECQLSHDELSKRVGKSRSVITNSLRLLKLPKEVQQMVSDNAISMGHARAILSFKSSEEQCAIAQKVVEQGLSVRDVEKLTQSQKESKTSDTKKSNNKQQHMDPNLKDIVEQLQYKFGTSVAVNTNNGQKGKIEIPFFSSEDLNRILDILNG